MTNRRTQRWREIMATLSSPHFWLTLLGILGVVAVWLYLMYLGMQYDVRIGIPERFCSTIEERDKHILVIVLSIPFFLVGIIGVISEWMAIMAHRRAGRRFSIRSLVVFSTVMMVATLIILVALRC